MFGGYGIYREPNALKPLSWMPGPLKARLKELISRTNRSFRGKNYLLRRLLVRGAIYLATPTFFRGKKKNDCFADYQIMTPCKWGIPI